MKISAGFLVNPKPGIACVLIYGPNRGLVSTRADTLVGSVADDPGDPFRVTVLEPESLKSDPARLADEANALSMTGGRRVVRVQGAHRRPGPGLRGSPRRSRVRKPGGGGGGRPGSAIVPAPPVRENRHRRRPALLRRRGRLARRRDQGYPGRPGPDGVPGRHGLPRRKSRRRPAANHRRVGKAGPLHGRSRHR